MFTDGQATPVRLEVLLDTLKHYSRGLKREVINGLLQPSSLSGSGHPASKDSLSAALQLGLINDNNDIIKLTSEYNKKKSSRENILRAIDQQVLSTLDIEFYTALFYSYLLGLNKQLYERQKNDTNDKWAERFNDDIFKGQRQDNPFNRDKISGLHKWLSYSGLGWYDPSGNFQINPYERLLRVLPDIFDTKSKLQGDDFMIRMAQICPELDGGDIFLKANEYQNYELENKQCTLGVSHALVDLHEDKIIKLVCQVDSLGWNIGLSEPSRDDTIKSERITQIEYLGK